MVFSHRLRLRFATQPLPKWLWLAVACLGAAPTIGWAQARPQAASRPQPVPRAEVAPKVVVTPSAKPLPPAKLEEALRLMLRADSANRRPTRLAVEAEGLVLDQAISKIGHDFYDLFYGAFEAPPGSVEFTVLVGERPGRGNSSLLVLTVNDQELIETPLPTRLDQQEELVSQAVEIAQGYLAEAQNIARQLEASRRTPLEVY
jgi:curli production assembly/transport component CsgE